MPTVLIAGPARSGKTSLAAALFALVRESGRAAGYAKPFSHAGDGDRDHAFAADVLAEAFGVALGPHPSSPPDSVEDAAADVAMLQDRADTVIVELAGAPAGRDLADEVDVRVLEILPYARGRDWAAAADQAAGRWGNRLAALVINAVPPYRQEDVASSASESSADVETVIIPESRFMLAPTVAQIADHLEAVWTQEPVNADCHVERFLIGGNIMDNGPTYYGRYSNQAVITRTQRPDIQLASMLPETRCLVLTGPGEPTAYVRAEAMERDIPLLQVFSSTIETADALDRLIESSTPYSLEKVRHYLSLVREQVGAETLERWLS